MKWIDFLHRFSGFRADALGFQRWTAGIDKSWAAYLSDEPLFSIMDEAAARYGDRPCVNFLGKSYSYAEIGDLVNRAAHGFQQLGVAKGVKVGLFLPNTPYFVICYYAILKAGGTVVNFNPLYVEREIIQQIEDSETDIMVTLDLRQLYPKVAAILDTTRLKKVVYCRMNDILPPVKGLLFSTFKRSELAAIPEDLRHIPFDLLVKTDDAPEPVDIDPHTDIAVLQYTGGTTGLPKGAMLTHGNLVANTRQVRSIAPDLIEGEERILGVLPLFHVFAMTTIMNHGIALGAELILLPRFDLDQTLRTIDARKPTIFPAVPTIYGAINRRGDLSKFELSSLKFCISGGAPLPLEIKRQFEDRTGCVLIEGYGLSEASPIVTCNPIDGITKENSIGLPLPATEIKIRSLKPPHNVVRDGNTGELWVRGPQVMAGYWNRPDETAQTLRDGFLRTGDVGYRDPDGYLFLIDRLKDVIICSGYNVYPRVIEEAIYLHPTVAEVTVIGVDDDYRGQAPKAFIKLQPGTAVSEDDLRHFLADKLSSIERPKYFEFRDELPKTMIGKLSKKELVAEERARGEQEGTDS